MNASWKASLLSALLLGAGCDDAPKNEKPDESEKSEPMPALAAALSAAPSKVRPEKESKRRPKSILLAEARELIGWRVADGFLSREEILSAAVQSADGRESLKGELEKVVDEELSAHRKREAEWRFLTDADRLSRAFKVLDKQGIIARERFSDCRKCGVADMKLLREDLLERGLRADGYVFFTDQDADGLSESGELVLEYGSFREDAEAAQKVGGRVEQVLKAEGLSPVAETDDEGGETYLVLSGLEWQKRRFTKAPAK